MRIFVYGTLKRGHRLHHHLAGQRYVGPARTCAEFRLLNCGWYPALVESDAGRSICGEVWDVCEKTLERLDDVEGVSCGLYRRQMIPLLPPYDDVPAMTYVYQRSVTGLTDCGDEWTLFSAEPHQAEDA